ncbi:hypothetical protein [Streptomyces mirabilis]|uniref:hypothetical protein n=1 Tax=Streptomyces mirabilis TaxID=68239 RepID=UPI0036AD8117
MNDRTWQGASTGTARSHYAAMRRYEDGASNLTDLLLDGEVPAGDKAAVKAWRDSYYLHAAAYRSAGRRRERADRFWATRPGTLLRITLRGIHNVRAAVTA